MLNNFHFLDALSRKSATTAAPAAGASKTAVIINTSNIVSILLLLHPSDIRQTIEQRFIMPCRVPVVWIFLQLLPGL